MDLALRTLHVLVAAAWFGHKLLVPGDIRAAVTDSVESTRELLPRLRRAERMGQFSGVGTLATGGLLIWWVGVEGVAVTKWIGLGLVLAAILTGAIVARPASNAFHASAEAGDRPGAARAGRTITRVLAVESLLWAATLALMMV